ncbi:conjugal transfer protein, partial [Lactiplantibacillus garii]
TKQKFIRNTFKNTKCCDELFLQTLLVNSPFEKNLFDNTFSDSITANERFIVWVNGAPRDLKIDDLSSLKASECLFARKFNTDSDEQIINDIV